MSQTEQYTVARCPSCAVKLKFRPSRPPRTCPRCKRAISFPPPVPVGVVPGPAPIVAGPPRPPQAAAKPLGFAAYLAAHWRASRCHWIVPLLLGLLAAAAASLVKPVLGIWGLVAGVATVLGIALICGLTYFMGRVIDYAIRGGRDPKVSAPSWFGRLAHLTMIMLVPLGAVVAAESLGPRRGWLATWVPSLSQIVPAGGGEPATPDQAPGGGAESLPGGERPAADDHGGDASKPDSAQDSLADPANPFKLIEE